MFAVSAQKRPQHTNVPPTTAAPMPLRVGTSGWSYDDWEGHVYRNVPVSDRLVWYATQLPSVEVDSTYYRDPAPAVVEGWARKTAKSSGFELSVKGPKRLTHEALVDATPAECASAAASWAELVAAPLARAKRLGAILLQLSPAVLHKRSSLERLDATLAAFEPHEVAVEFRNPTWHEGGAYARDTLATLDARNAALVVVDGPHMPTMVAGAADHAYVRFHGRNAESWYTPESYHGSRYDYEYSEAELRPWAERLAAMAREKRDVRVFFNNHVEGKAFRNARQMEPMLETAGAEVVRARSPQTRLPF